MTGTRVIVAGRVIDGVMPALQAKVQDIQHESAQPLLPIIHDPHLTAIQKLQGFLSALDRVRMDHQQDVIDAARVWYTDANAIVRPFPDQAGEVSMALLQGMPSSGR